MTKINATSGAPEAATRDTNLLARLDKDSLTPSKPATRTVRGGDGKPASAKAGRGGSEAAPVAPGNRSGNTRANTQAQALRADPNYVPVPNVPRLPRMKSQGTSSGSLPVGYRPVPAVTPLPNPAYISPAQDGYRPVPAVPSLPKVQSRIATRTGDEQRTDAATASTQAKFDRTTAEVMRRSNPVTEQLNLAVKDFYRTASGGRATRDYNNLLGPPLRMVIELQRVLASVIADSKPLIAANGGDRGSVAKLHSSLVQSYRAMDVWVKNANAYAAGLTKPGGEHTKTPTLVRPPTPSRLDAKQETAEIRLLYERANAAIGRL